MKHPLLLLALLGGCSAPAATLGYTPGVAPRIQAAPVVSLVTVTDERRGDGPRTIGALRGSLGDPWKPITTSYPVKDEVAAVFAAALQARGLYDPHGRAALAVTLTELNGNQVARQEGHTRFDLVLLDRPSGRPVFRDAEDVLTVGSRFIASDVGVFASAEELRTIASQSLSEAIDKALDKPGFAAAR